MKKGKVVKVLNSLELVINLGAADGVSEDQIFVVYAIGDEIVDPDSGGSLGALEILRGKGFARHVQAHMTTLRSMEMRTEAKDRLRPRNLSPIGGLRGLVASLGDANTMEYVSRAVQVDAPFDGPEVGDLVRTM